MKTQNPSILIIGAKGKTGSRVSKQLKQLGYSPYEAGRHGPIYFDWHVRSSWAHALSGMESIYLTYYPDLAVPEAPDDITYFCKLAKERGVKHITLLSGRGEAAATHCENILKQSGIDWTIVRAAWFNQNFSDGLFKHFILNGKIALPTSTVREPFVDIDDIAQVVVASLTEGSHKQKLYEVTGPELLTFEDLAQRFTQLLNVDVQFESISMQEFCSNLEVAGVESGAIQMLTYLFGEVLDGRNEYVTEGVSRALGRPASNFNQFIINNKESLLSPPSGES
ncbi:NmrA family transcriptional regulator [Alteromonadaceae bacterium M269]|nr:NmrA family transcriptional regulator [Alteromonadaceae bacterium M269]